MRTLADGREIIYFDDTPDAPARTAVDTRDLPLAEPLAEIRRDPLTEEWVAVAAHRQTRTYKPPADLCPLCPSAEGRPTEIPEPDYDVVVFENRFPSFAEDVSDTPSTVDGSSLVPMAPGRGRCEVVSFTSDHSRSFGQLDPQRVRTVLDVWADRTAALSASEHVRQVFVFENRGEEIGVTLHHPHGQIYGYPFVTPKTSRLLEVAGRYLTENGRPLMGDVLAAEEKSGKRVLAATEHWLAYVPSAARWPVEAHIVPRRQVADLAELSADERDDFVLLYLDLLGKMDGLYDRPLPYIAGWHQAPAGDGRELGWLYLELFSVMRSRDKLKYLAGSESGMRVWINDATPEQIAGRLRAAPSAAAPVPGGSR